MKPLFIRATITAPPRRTPWAIKNKPTLICNAIISKNSSSNEWVYRMIAAGRSGSSHSLRRMVCVFIHVPQKGQNIGLAVVQDPGIHHLKWSGWGASMPIMPWLPAQVKGPVLHKIDALAENGRHLLFDPFTEDRQSVVLRRNMLNRHVKILREGVQRGIFGPHEYHGHVVPDGPERSTFWDNSWKIYKES